jgi:multidrug transporter EmrE-like cation transporter
MVETIDSLPDYEAVTVDFVVLGTIGTYEVVAGKGFAEVGVDKAVKEVAVGKTGTKEAYAVWAARHSAAVGAVGVVADGDESAGVV